MRDTGLTVWQASCVHEVPEHSRGEGGFFSTFVFLYGFLPRKSDVASSQANITAVSRICTVPTLLAYRHQNPILFTADPM